MKTMLVPNVLLRDARKRRRWTQKDVAERIGVAPISIGRWERGEAVPGPYACRKLCGLFDKRAKELGLPEEGKAQVFNQLDGDAGYDGTATLEGGHLPWYQNLKRERQLRGWSQDALASQIGCDAKSVSRWERGATLPTPYNIRRLIELLGKNAEELGLMGVGRSQEGGRMYKLTPRTITMNMRISHGDCGCPEVTAMLDTVVIDPRRGRMMFYFRFTNGTTEDVGLEFENLSLTDPNGDFFLGRTVGSFHLGAGQMVPQSAVFDWIPQGKVVYRLDMVLVRPNKWRNTYRPLLLPL